MPENKRGNTGRFEKGVSGNPAGRPKGSKNRNAELYNLLGDDGASIVRQLIRQAKRGEPVALRLAVERLLPRGRTPVVCLDLPQLVRAADLLEASRGVIAAAAEGRISVMDAEAFVRMLEGQRKLLETEELTVRIEALETRGGDKHGKA